MRFAKGMKRLLPVCAAMFVFAAVLSCAKVSKASAEEDLWGRNYYNMMGQLEWTLEEYVSDIRVASESYSLGSQQNVTLLFENSVVPDRNGYNDWLVVSLRDEFGETLPGTERTVYARDFVVGTNSIVIPYSFTERGIYYFTVREGFDLYLNEYNTQKYQFVVKRATNEFGENIDVKDSVDTDAVVYTKSQAKQVKVSYTVSDGSANYVLYIHRNSEGFEYQDDKMRMVEGSDYMSVLDEISVKIGETHTVTYNLSNEEFGKFVVALYNASTGKKVAEKGFYMLPENCVLQRDPSRITETGMIPLSFESDKNVLNLSEDESINFKVELPFNYGAYIEELEKDYQHVYGVGYNEYKYSDESEYATMMVYYIPEYSNKKRLLFKEELTHLYKTQEIEITAEELEKAIYETGCITDVGYAGEVVISITNEEDRILNLPFDNPALEYFTEEFSFGVCKNDKIKSAKASSKSVDRSYGESVSFTVTHTMGGKIYADIYKGSKKIATVNGECYLNDDGTATGTVEWDLKKSSNTYAAAGSYKAKIYTRNEYPVYDEDGKCTIKKVKSKVKSVSFKLVNPAGSLSMTTVASGSDGSNAVYVESPTIGVQTTISIGSQVSVQIKNSNGTLIKSGSYEGSKGTTTYRMNLDGLVNAGTYKVSVTAKTLDGQTKTATSSFTVRKLPKASISDASVSTDTNSGTGSLSFKVSQTCNVYAVIKSGSTVKETLLNQNYSAGTVKTSFSTGNLAVGTYSIVITASNSGGSSTMTKSFEVKKKPVVVKKPTASALNIRYSTGKDGDTYKCSFNYTGKGAKVVIDIMYNDTEDIVFTYEGTTKNDSGTFSYTWDGFKSNGFKAWTGSYTVRVHLVNSAGSTDYLRQNFTIGEG